MKNFIISLALAILLSVNVQANVQHTEVPYRIKYNDEVFMLVCMQDQCIVKDITVDKGRRKGRVTVNFTEESYLSNFGESFDPQTVIDGRYTKAELELETGNIVWVHCDAPNGYVLTLPGQDKKYCSDDYHYLKLYKNDTVTFEVPGVVDVDINEGEAVFRLNR